MRPKLASPTWWYLGLVAFSLAGTVLNKVTGLDPGLIKPIASVLVLVAGLLALVQPLAFSIGVGRAAWAVIAILLVGLVSEVVGIYTGYPFGRYAYTDQWRPVIGLPGGHFLPLPVLLAWFLVAGGSYLFVAHRFAGFWAIPLGAVLAAFIDLAMEPIMVNTLGYWRWLEVGPLPGGAALLNPLGWLLTSWLAGAILHRCGAEKVSHTPDAGYVLLGFLFLMAGIAISSML
jgi:putative membrane protein